MPTARFRGLDKNIERAKGFTNLTTFCRWTSTVRCIPVLDDRRRSMPMWQFTMLAQPGKSVEKMLPIWSFCE
ncbi:MAG: hypothetical protein ACLTZY_06805 [Alistipes indistinctus]